MVRDLAAFYADIALEIIEGVLYAHIGGQVLKLVFKAGKWIVQGVVRVSGAVYEGMEVVVLGGFVLVYEGSAWILKAMIAPTTTAQRTTRHTIWGIIGAAEGAKGPDSVEPGPIIPPNPFVSPYYYGGWCAGKLYD